MTEAERRRDIVSTAARYIGAKKGDSKHLAILATYNSTVDNDITRKRYTPEARKHKMTVSEPWCATFVSAISVGILGEKEYPLECSCGNQIKQLQSMGEWVEADDFVPSPGDLIYYDWEDSGKGENKGAANHVGIVEKVEDNTITVIEGNKNNTCARRTIKVNGRYIRGFGHIKFSGSTEAKPLVETKVISEDKSYQAKVTTKAGLNIRTGAGTGYKKVGALKYGTVVTVTKVDMGWGYIGTGWICLDYTKEI